MRGEDDPGAKLPEHALPEMSHALAASHMSALPVHENKRVVTGCGCLAQDVVSHPQVDLQQAAELRRQLHAQLHILPPANEP